MKPANAVFGVLWLVWSVLPAERTDAQDAGLAANSVAVRIPSLVVDHKAVHDALWAPLGLLA